ncbi:UDP-N-acetylglucosamine 2-epimerase (non-hydrolyzing) [Fusobacterium necrophorum]|uniref:non-hydrolyzing UDP-N-acetylglucosamine 2-epimerase n=1 Tax=Fusobacterium necrophorum TaxID=859 RepID=UPI000887BE5B|nr:UDP-N-acetylglucosamine 2-epimerase (non-hydrolyzing) [Fusobacterium necrophorum]AYZ73042.1 UDP-N-acetylglucosamine 2-epimerase (non-hydrolyzing) [Fusobacterium necrophorum]AZW08958.1 UDP-N-acetylglucosamine 2-epimerase (non-hydrolyzing) [Fusobacterium necrophorum subsp. necrophorum]SDB39795.1 UDP-N-acetylglucosamine 2-epimerase (non-hydrolysing) [Fusobacterium necrophorum]SQD09944.1 UDP-N-acetylglucosamine 2-epimerase [Fusobacterium necrophorum subsp. necrophorum]
MKIGIIFGTRPEAIKLAPVYYELKKRKISTKIVVTGQHKEMLYQVLNVFGIQVDYDLHIMSSGQGLPELTGNLMLKLNSIFGKEQFDYILVQGDTTSAYIGALTAFYHKIPVGHIEAGLRTYNIYSPFPEEVNRRMISVISSIHFAPTDTNVKNLRLENYPLDRIIKCGNTIIDALVWVKTNKSDLLKEIRNKYNLYNKRYILITMHRRENWGKPMENTLTAIREYLKQHEELFLVFPIHKNPIVRKIVHQIFDNFNQAILLEPLEYLDFIAVMDGAHYIMTDSGGIQEEAPSLGKPVLVLRDTTERPEGLEAGTTKLIGNSPAEITKYMKLLEGDLYHNMASRKNPYGDGHAANIIVSYLVNNKG